MMMIEKVILFKFVLLILGLFNHPQTGSCALEQQQQQQHQQQQQPFAFMKRLLDKCSSSLKDDHQNGQQITKLMAKGIPPVTIESSVPSTIKIQNSL
jgi:hypothetical protein